MPAPEPRERKRTLIADPASFRTEFIDSVQAVSQEDILILEFLQSLPNSMAEDDAEPVRISARLAFTWSHAERLRDLLSRVIEKNKLQSNGDNDDND